MTQQRNWFKYLNLNLIFIVLCCAGVLCFAQTDRGSVSGTVTDPTGAGVTGAKVTVTNAAMGTQNSTVTTGAGDYTIPQLPAGVYSVTVVAPGFTTLVRSGITVSVGPDRTCRHETGCRARHNDGYGNGGCSFAPNG